MIKEEIAFRGEIVISDPDGSNEQVFPMNSLLRNFACWFSQVVDYIASANYYGKNSLNASVNFINNSTHKIYDSADATYGNHIYNGIMIGTGTPAKTADMYAMGTPITDNVSTITTYPPLVSMGRDTTVGAEKSYVNITRTFKNITASDITIKEIGLTFYNAANAYTMLIYDQPEYNFVAGTQKSFQIRLVFDNTVVPVNLARFVKASLWTPNSDMLRTTNNISSIINAASSFRSLIAENEGVTYLNILGLSLGTDDTASIPDQYDLNAQISNDVLYKRHSSNKYAIYLDGSDYCYKVRRSFTNAANDTVVTVKEIGYHIYLATGNGYLIFRTVVPDIVFPVAETIEFELTFRFIY
jgi:hypothetical protein